MAAATPISNTPFLESLYPEIMCDPILTTDQKIQRMWVETRMLADGFCKLETQEFNMENLVTAQKKLLEKGKNIKLLWRAVLAKNRNLALERKNYEQTPQYQRIHDSGNLIRIFKDLNTWMLEKQEYFNNTTHLKLTGSLIKLTEIPVEITVLRNLKALYIDDNNLTSIPDGLEQLENLEIINFARNPQLKDLPESLAKIKNLRIFSLRGTQIKLQSLSIALQAKVDIHPDNDELLPPPPPLQRQKALLF
ncbi:MAG: leucine-rich repeat domain-containing protein [Chlamydiota bacterium]|jgi:Leucine-rich repeat (LRR) protein